MYRKLISFLLIIHGMIHLLFEFIIYDSATSMYVGWSGQSWLLTNAIGTTAVLIIGRIIWGLTIAGFVIAGIALWIKWKYWRLTAIITSGISLLGYLFFWDGLSPEPFYWIAGPIIGGLVIVFLLIVRWPKNEKLFANKGI